MTIQMNGMMMRRMIMKINNLILLPLLLITPAACASEYDDENHALFDGYLPPSPLPNVEHAPAQTPSVYPAQEQCSALHQSAKRAADVQKFLKKLQSSENLQPCAAAAISNSKSQKKKKSFVCTICNISFPRASSLTRHNLIHDGEKKYVCEICHKSFGYTSHLKKHMLIHTGQKPFACDLCGQECRQKNDLKKHLRTHSGEKPYTCDPRKINFSDSSNLKDHEKTKKHLKNAGLLTTADQSSSKAKRQKPSDTTSEQNISDDIEDIDSQTDPEIETFCGLCNAPFTPNHKCYDTDDNSDEQEGNDYEYQ